MSHISSGNGYCKCELSNDNGDTWKNLGTYNGYIDPWSQRSYNFAAINAAGASFSPPSGGAIPPAQSTGFAQAAGVQE